MPERTLSECYALLGIDASTTVEEINEAFRRKAKGCHPDLAGGDADCFKALLDAKERALLAAGHRPAAGRRPSDSRGEPALPTLSPSEIVWAASGASAPRMATIRLANAGGPLVDPPVIDRDSGPFWWIAGYDPLPAPGVADIHLESVNLDDLPPGTHEDLLWVAMDDTYAELALSVTVGERRPPPPISFRSPAMRRSRRRAVVRRGWPWVVGLLFVAVSVSGIFDTGGSGETLIRGGSLAYPPDSLPRMRCDAHFRRVLGAELAREVCAKGSR